MGLFSVPTVPTLRSYGYGPLAPESWEEKCPRKMKVDHLQPSYYQSSEWQAEGWLFLKLENRDNIFKGTVLGKLNLQPDYSFFFFLREREGE